MFDQSGYLNFKIYLKKRKKSKEKKEKNSQNGRKNNNKWECQLVNSPHPNTKQKQPLKPYARQTQTFFYIYIKTI